MDILVLLAITSHGRFNGRRTVYAILDTMATAMGTSPRRLNSSITNEPNSCKALWGNGILVRHDQGYCHCIPYHHRFNHDFLWI